MADFTALKTAIQTYIKQNGNEEIKGEILQEILLSVVTTLGDSAINNLVTALADEVAARQNADGTLQQNITNEATARGNADTALSNRLGSTITAENTAADQIGAEAEAREAADTALQELIDGITDNIENGYVYAGIATPSSTPATGKVFYLALTAGTYTNFGSTEVSQGINILKYNGSAWSLDAFIGIDDELTPGSNNIPKSGNVLENIIKNGSAFDLSAYNAVDGVLATYADLDAALAALNLLPAVYKQGGMSFRFVQSSDNNYVQYRLMSTSFSTTESDWQGVSTKPTADSVDCVEAGGVYETERVIGSKLNTIYNNYYFDPDHLVDSNLSVTPPVLPHYTKNEDFDSAWIAIVKGSTKLTVTGATARRFRFFSSFDVNSFATTQIESNTDGTIPTGAILAIILFSKSDNTGGYGNLVITQDNQFVTKDKLAITSRGVYVDYNHYYAVSSNYYEYDSNWDSLLIPISYNVKKVIIENATPRRFRQFSAPILDSAHFVGTNDTGDIIDGAKFLAVAMLKTDNPDGYDNVNVRWELNDSTTVLSKIEEGDKKASRGFYIDYDHIFSVEGANSRYIENTSFDSVWVSINSNYKKLYVENGTPLRFCFFSSPVLTVANYLGNNTDGTVISGAKFCSITMRKSDNTDGYDNLLVRWDLNLDVYAKTSDIIAGKLMKIVKSGNYIKIRTKLSDENDIAITMYQNANGLNMTFDSFYVGAKTLSDAQLISSQHLINAITDIVGAIGIQTFWFLYAQHGWTIPKMTVSSQTLDNSDIGSVWADSSYNDRRFVIGKIDGNNIYLIPEITKDNETDIYSAAWDGSMSYPTTLVHVSGATHTDTISGTSSRYDLHIQNVTKRVLLVDGKEISDDGTYYCDEFSINENVLGYNIGKIETWFPEPVYNGSLIDWDRTLIFKGSMCTCNTIINCQYPFKLTDYRGCIPMMPLQVGDYHSYSFIPKVKKQVNGHRVDLPFNCDDGAIGNNAVSVVRNSTDLYNIDNQPERCINYLKDNSDNYLVGMAGGCSLIRGISIPEKRNIYNPVNTSTCTYGGSSTPNKFYPKPLQGSAFENNVVDSSFIKEFSCYYCWFDPSANEGQVYWYKDDDSYIVYCHCQTAQSKLAINLPDFMEGMVVESTIEKTDGATLLTTQIVSGRLYVSYDTTDNAANYIVVRLK